MGVATAVAERRGVPVDQLQAPPRKAEAGKKDESQPAKAAADRPASIQGKTIDEWLAALKDRDPAVRERAVEVVGERSLDPALPADEKSRLQIALNTLMSSDKDRGVRQSAAFFADLQRMAHSPERLKRALEVRRRVVKPMRVTIRLVDAEGRPVQGAVASTFFQKDPDHGPSFVRVVDPRGSGNIGRAGASWPLRARDRGPTWMARVSMRSGRMGTIPSSVCTE